MLAKILQLLQWMAAHPVQTVVWFAIVSALLYILAAVTFAIVAARDELRGYRQGECFERDQPRPIRPRAAGLQSGRKRVS